MPRPETLERDTTAKAVAGRLRDEIQHGDLAPGTRLRQNDVAKRFGVSTTPVREAFAQLQAEGLLRIDPHRGAVVFHPTVEDLIEFYEIREALESLAITHALPNLTEATLRELGTIVGRMRKTADPKRWLKLNDEFHLRLYRAAGRPRLSGLIDSLREASTPYMYLAVASRLPAARADEEHQEILDACLGRDAGAARRAIKAHLRNATNDLTESLGGRDVGRDVESSIGGSEKMSQTR